MKITRLSRAGAQVQTKDMRILLDPSEEGVPPRTLAPPDVLLITHAHADRLDMGLVGRLLAEAPKPVTVFAPSGAYPLLCTFGGGHRYVHMRPHSVYSIGGVTVYAVLAEHGDTPTVGYLIDDGKSTCYAVGDTLYNYDVIDDVSALAEEGPDVALLPLGEEDNTMHPKDAASFLYEIGARAAIPLCFGPYADGVPKTFDFEKTLPLPLWQAQDFPCAEKS